MSVVCATILGFVEHERKRRDVDGAYNKIDKIEVNKKRLSSKNFWRRTKRKAKSQLFDRGGGRFLGPSWDTPEMKWLAGWALPTLEPGGSVVAGYQNLTPLLRPPYL